MCRHLAGRRLRECCRRFTHRSDYCRRAIRLRAHGVYRGGADYRLGTPQSQEDDRVPLTLYVCGRRMEAVRLSPLIVISRDTNRVSRTGLLSTGCSGNPIRNRQFLQRSLCVFRRRPSWIISFSPGVRLTNSVSKLARKNLDQMRPMKSDSCLFSKVGTA